MSAETFWRIVIIAALSGYFGLALVIAIGGWFDIWRMLRRLGRGRAPSESSNES
jgi:hypothetical protein